jgi:predicted Zn-dependent protease
MTHLRRSVASSLRRSATPAYGLLLAIALLPGCSSGGANPGTGAAIGELGGALGNMMGGSAGRATGQISKSAANVLTAGELLTEADEDEMGRAVAIAATNTWKLYDKPELTKYVTLVGLTVADASARPDGKWVFGVLDTPDVGAYSGPNGYILITRGALNVMQDEAELAAVLAHEIAHVVNHDGLNSVKDMRVSQAAIKEVSANVQHAAVLKQSFGQLAETILKSGWNQSQETAADTAAVDLLIASGYDPGGLPRFLARMAQRQGSASAKPFSTHPGTADRIARTTSQIGPAKTGATNRDRFAKAAAEAKL